jgi:UDP-GlcNAc:undecaprenyl-phosphate GlcNAc-1-phosphate transferase
VGICDDLKAFSAIPKFGLQICGALVAVYLGNRFTVTGSPVVDSFISVFWILTLVNAYNFIDVCDGLAAGIGAVAFAVLALRGAAGGIHPLAAGGAALGFLAFNRPPASIFLGDAGSHLLGFLAAAFSMSLFGSNLSWPRLPEMLLISGVPLFELVFITLVRLYKGIPWWKGSPDHFALRLQAAGMTRLQADLCGWLAAIVMALVGVSLELLSRAEGIACIATLLLVIAAATMLLLKLDAGRISRPVATPV